MTIDSIYLSRLSSDLDGGVLLAVYVLASCAAACPTRPLRDQHAVCDASEVVG